MVFVLVFGLLLLFGSWLLALMMELIAAAIAAVKCGSFVIAAVAALTVSANEVC